MFSFKIWPLVLAIYSFVIDRDHVFLSATYVPSGVSRDLKIVVGGYVGMFVRLIKTYQVV